MSKPKSLAANRRQGSSVAERERATDWGGPDTAASPLPIDQHHTRRSYMGYGQLPQDARRELALPGREQERLVVNLSAPQIVHSALSRPRGMPGKRDFSDGTGPTGRVKAVIRHDYGLGPLVTRPADEGTDPGADAVDTDYRRQPAGPRPDVLAKYVGCRRHLPELTEGQGYSRLHELSRMSVAGRDLLATFERAGQ